MMKPSNSPTQGQPNPRKSRLKVAFGTLSRRQIVFRGLGLVLCRKQTTRNLTQPKFSGNSVINSNNSNTNARLFHVSVRLFGRSIGRVAGREINRIFPKIPPFFPAWLPCITHRCCLTRCGITLRKPRHHGVITTHIMFLLFLAQEGGGGVHCRQLISRKKDHKKAHAAFLSMSQMHDCPPPPRTVKVLFPWTPCRQCRTGVCLPVGREGGMPIPTRGVGYSLPDTYRGR